MGQSADKKHGDKSRHSANQHRYPEGRIPQIYQGQVNVHNSREGKYQAKGSPYSLHPSHQAENQNVGCRKADHRHSPVLGINAGNDRIPGHALQHDYVHSHCAGGSEQKSGTAGGHQTLPLFLAAGHFYYNGLLAYTGSVGLKIILKNLNNHTGLKGLTGAVYQLGLGDIVQAGHKAHRNYQNHSRDDVFDNMISEL